MYIYTQVITDARGDFRVLPMYAYILWVYIDYIFWTATEKENSALLFLWAPHRNSFHFSTMAANPAQLVPPQQPFLPAGQQPQPQ